MKKKTFATKNLKLLVTRLEGMLDSPEAMRFNMRYFGNKFHYAQAGALKEFPPVCNTQACLAGETVLALGTGQIMEIGGGIQLTTPERIGHSGWAILFQAKEDLGLNQKQADRLFFFTDMGRSAGWPKEFEIAYNSAKTPQGRLYVAIRRVEQFIKTRGRK